MRLQTGRRLRLILAGTRGAACARWVGARACYEWGMTNRHRLLELDRRHVWRPYTSSLDHAARDPVVVARAEGPYLVDDTGRRLIDGNGSWWCNNLGHGHPRLREAIARQSASLMHCSFGGATHEAAVLLAEELVALAPEGLTRVFYSDDGSTAVEVAAKIAFQFWQQNGEPGRTRFLSLEGAYHGDTFGAMSLGDSGTFHDVFSPLKFPVVHCPAPEDELWENVARFVERELEERGGEYAALIVEPIVQGAAGMRVYPPAILRRMREATRRADVFLIADEVFTGFGRTGPFWACAHAGVAPDLLASAKGLSGGVLPFAATLASERIYDGFRGDKTRALMHGHTFFGNPLGAAVAREVLAIYRDEDVLGRAASKAETLARGIASLDSIPGVRRTRSIGMVGAVDLGEGGYLGETGWRVASRALELGAQLRPLGDTLYVVPPLNIPDAVLDALLGILADALSDVLTE
jgi:adenosylmethionine---8-amino-7-oxononanoate aminotransferase